MAKRTEKKKKKDLEFKSDDDSSNEGVGLDNPYDSEEADYENAARKQDRVEKNLEIDSQDENFIDDSYDSELEKDFFGGKQ